MSCVLDAWAVLALLRDEPATPTVVDWIRRGGARMSWVNLGEVYYGEARRVGDARAAEAIDAVRGIVTTELPDEDLVLAAARIKAAHPLSFADAFGVATAERHRLPFLTGDPELIALDRPAFEVVDLH